MLWSSSISTGLIGGNLTLGAGSGCSSELVINVKYPVTGRSWSRLNNSCWCPRSTGEGTEGGMEIGEETGMAEAGEELRRNEGSIKGGWDLPSEVMSGVSPEMGGVDDDILVDRSCLELVE